MNLEKLTTLLKYEDSILIPSLEAEEDKLSLSGAAVLENGRKIGHLTEDELRGYLWCINSGGLGAVVTAAVKGESVPFKVEKHKANIRFKEQGNDLLAHIYVELTGRVDELAYDSELLTCPNYREYTQRRIEAAVKDEILRTAAKMQEDFNLDGYHWLETMRKKQYSLYQRHAYRWADTFADIEVVPHVKVTVRS